MANAAFSQQALEDDRGGAGMSSKIDDMTETMIRYTKRIASLEDADRFRYRARAAGRAVFARRSQERVATAGRPG